MIKLCDYGSAKDVFSAQLILGDYRAFWSQNDGEKVK